MDPEFRTPADRSFDLSLRVLTILVMVGLAGSIGVLAYGYLEPVLHPRAPVAPPQVTVAAPAPAPDPAPAARPDEVLMNPGHVIKCEEHGRASYSDKACAGGTPR